ncbi:MAG: hypothetical protein JWN43_4488, partial [Gammaproteobacteria bacterium]|nr:hypothetical protein [Gammaproteobacteria bacterium]
MFITRKRHEREKQEILGHSSRLTDALLRSTGQGMFLLDAKGKIVPPVSQSLAKLFRREDFSGLTFEKLLAPVVSAKTLTLARGHVAGLIGSAPQEPTATNPLADVDVRLANSGGPSDSMHYSFDFDPVIVPDEAPTWLVRVTDITMLVQSNRELEELRNQVFTQSEILRGVLQMGGARFAGFIRKTDESMKTIGTVLKRSAREHEAFRQKLEETLHEVDLIRREAAAFKLTAMESAARTFEDALQDVRSRSALSGSDVLPLAVKMDQLYNQFALIKTLAAAAGPVSESDAANDGARMTHNGTQVIEAPRFTTDSANPKAVPGAHRTAAAGSLDSALQALTDHVSAEHGKRVSLESCGLQLVPAQYQAMIKNVAIQLIRNAVMHGIEPAAVREAAGKPVRGTLRL